MRIRDWSSDVCSSDLASWEERSAIVDQSKAIHEKAKTEGIDLAAGDREAGADEAKSGDEPAAGKSDAELIADKARQRAIVLAEMAAADEAADAAWPAPHFAEVQAQRGKDWRTFVSYIPFQILVSTLPLFMLGSWLVRSGRVRNAASHRGFRSEEHTSELQSLMRISYAVFC